MAHERTAQYPPIVMATFDGRPDRVVSTEIDPDHLALLLMGAASSFADYPCSDYDCDGCNAFKLAYWRLDSMLPSSVRRNYQRTLREAGTPLPDAPWEEVG